MMQFDFDSARVTPEGELCLKVKNLPAARQFVLSMKNRPYTCEVKEQHKKRSLDANAYFWTLCDQLAEATRIPKEEIYREVVEYEVNHIIERLQKAASSALPPDRKLRLYILARFNVVDNLVRGNKYVRYDFVFNSLRVEQLRRRIDVKERQLLTEILQDGKEQGIFNINDPVSFARTLLIMFKSLEQPFVIIGHRNRNYQTLREYVDLLFNGILNKTKL